MAAEAEPAAKGPEPPELDPAPEPSGEGAAPTAAKDEDPQAEAKEALVAVEPKEEALVVKKEVKKEETKGRHVKKDMVPLFIEERGHGRDGELLRDFILRREHLKEDPRVLAVDRWLIRAEFYDDCFQEYVQQYGGEPEVVDLEERAQEVAEACKDVMVVAKVKKKVDELESVAQTGAADVYALRDTLLAAVKDLTTPRRRLGVPSKQLMDDDCKEELKKKEQARLRQVVVDCLKRIWESGVGGEVLKIALEAVKSRINRFKAKAGERTDIIEAMAGHQWAQLEDLVQTIEEHEKSGAARQHLGPIEGRRTKLVIERALENLGGQASSRQVIEWIEQHPEELEKIREAKLNWHVRDGHRKPVWHSTVSSSMHHFRKITKPGQPTIYLAPNAEAPEELPAIRDAPDVALAAPARKPRKRPSEKAEAEGEAPEPKPKRSRKAKAKPKPSADAVALAAPLAADAPPEAAAPAAPVVPEVRPRSPQRKKKADDPLSLLLDAALEAADKAQ